MVDKEEADKIFQKLDNAHEELEDLKDQRDNLLKANKKLVEILINMENILQEKGVEIEEMDEHSYSFHRGWEDHQDSLQVENLDEDVEHQLSQLKKLIDGLEAL